MWIATPGRADRVQQLLLPEVLAGHEEGPHGGAEVTPQHLGGGGSGRPASGQPGQHVGEDERRRDDSRTASRGVIGSGGMPSASATATHAHRPAMMPRGTPNNVAASVVSVACQRTVARPAAG